MVGSGPWSDGCLSSPRVRPQQGRRDGGGGTFGLGAAIGLLAPLGCVWSPLLGSWSLQVAAVIFSRLTSGLL